MAELAKVQEQVELKDCWNLGHTVDIAKRALRWAAADDVEGVGS